ncbi:MAG: hypothetical protein JWM74_1195 [Myxococcaceae bacterium]|nr:hypothetical protein [Myxococcaceae bacterium]
MISRAARTRALLVLGVVVLFFAVAIASRVSAGSSAIAASDRALAAGDRVLAIEEARAAAEAVAPGSPYPARGYTRLDAIAREAEARDDDDTAAAAWRAMRTAAIGTRGLGVPDETTTLERANAGIARTATRVRGAARADLPREVPGVASPGERRILDALARDETPPVRVFLMLGAGAILFFAVIARLLVLASFAWKEARLAATASAVGLVLVVLALVR